MSPGTTPQSIILHFKDVVRVSGETIEGWVDLNLLQAQEEHIEQLGIKLRGSITAKITRNQGQSRITRRSNIYLIRSDILLWSQGAAFPEAGSHVLSCPFRFQLPANLPPSFHCSGHTNSVGTVSYALEVIGDRPGLFRSDRRIRRLISVVPAASQSQLQAQESLTRGWMGQWRDIARDEKLRTSIWGDYSHARATLSIPNLQSFPIVTPIPFSFHVVTKTKVVKLTDCPEDKHGRALFPTPPTHLSEVRQVLRRQTGVRVRGWTAHPEDAFNLQGYGPLRDVERVTQIDDPEWIPQDSKDCGIWKRAVHFYSTLSFPFAPTFSTETLDWQYSVQFVVPFPGIGNDLKLQFLIHLGAGSPCPPPPIGVSGSSNGNYADVPPAGLPPMQDLPPAYWTGDDHDWARSHELLITV